MKDKAGEIAKRLGNALVAPVLVYVPEGDISPPTGHMRFAGTISVPQDVFSKVLEYAARSLRQHGFIDIALVGDSGGNQAGQKLVAETLNTEWATTNARVHHITVYYPGRGDDWVMSQGVSAEDVGTHAGTHDTSSLMVPESVDAAGQPNGSREGWRRPGAHRQSGQSHRAVRTADPGHAGGRCCETNPGAEAE